MHLKTAASTALISPVSDSVWWTSVLSTLCAEILSHSLSCSHYSHETSGGSPSSYVWIHWTRYQTQFIKMNHVIIWGGFTFLWEDVDLCHVCRETQTEIFQVVSPYIFKNVSMSVFCKITSSVTGSDVILEGKHQNISKCYQRIWWILGCFVVLQ